jgi:hypothetical protein
MSCPEVRPSSRRVRDRATRGETQRDRGERARPVVHFDVLPLSERGVAVFELPQPIALKATGSLIARRQWPHRFMTGPFRSQRLKARVTSRSATKRGYSDPARSPFDLPRDLGAIHTWAEVVMRPIAGAVLLIAAIAACDGPKATSTEAVGCTKDTDCKGDRICESARCTAPATPAPPTASLAALTTSPPAVPPTLAKLRVTSEPDSAHVSEDGVELCSRHSLQGGRRRAHEKPHAHVRPAWVSVRDEKPARGREPLEREARQVAIGVRTAWLAGERPGHRPERSRVPP